MPGSNRDNLERVPEFYRRPAVKGRSIEPAVLDAFEKLWPWFWRHVGEQLGDPTRAGDLADEIVWRVSKHVEEHPGRVHSLGALCRVAAENYVKTIKKRDRRLDFRGLSRDIEATFLPATADLQGELELWVCADQVLRGEDAEFRAMLQRRLMDETWPEVGKALGMTGEQARRRFHRRREQIQWDLIFRAHKGEHS